MTIIILIVIFFVLYLLAENVLMLRVRRENLGGDVKIAHVADLHKRRFGKYNKCLCQKIASEKPDIILISGDFVSRDCTDFTAAEETLRSLCKIAPVYMVFGNHETDLYFEYKFKLIQSIKNSGAILLKNEVVQLDIRNRKLNLCGLELESSFYKKNGGYRNLDVLNIDQIHDLLGEKPSGTTILLTHNPLFAQVYAHWGADYAICGHVHGGAIRIPFTRIGLLSPERKILPKYTKGIYTVGITKILLSGGLGKFRMFNPPEIVVYSI